MLGSETVIINIRWVKIVIKYYDGGLSAAYMTCNGDELYVGHGEVNPVLGRPEGGRRRKDVDTVAGLLKRWFWVFV